MNCNGGVIPREKRSIQLLTSDALGKSWIVLPKPVIGPDPLADDDAAELDCFAEPVIGPRVRADPLARSGGSILSA